MTKNRTSQAVDGLLELGDLAYLLRKGTDVRPLRPILEKYQRMEKALELIDAGSAFGNELARAALSFDPLSP